MHLPRLRIRIIAPQRPLAASSPCPLSLFSGQHGSVRELMAISDAGEIMPPKSTWFEPKLRDGLLIHAVAAVAVPELRLEPRGLRRHDFAGIRNRHQLPHAHGEQRDATAARPSRSRCSR